MLFAGDGGGPDSVAHRTPLPDRRPLSPPGNGQWIYLFRPRSGESETRQVENETVKIGKLDVEQLVDLSSHNYRLEPNVTFTPDGRWVVFRSNIPGPTHVDAVEVNKVERGGKRSPCPGRFCLAFCLGRQAVLGPASGAVAVEGPGEVEFAQQVTGALHPHSEQIPAFGVVDHSVLAHVTEDSLLVRA